MTVMFVWNSELIGPQVEMKELAADTPNEEIESMFEEVLGVPFGDDCNYRKIYSNNYKLSEEEYLNLLIFKIFLENRLRDDEIEVLKTKYRQDARALLATDDYIGKILLI